MSATQQIINKLKAENADLSRFLLGHDVDPTGNGYIAATDQEWENKRKIDRLSRQLNGK